MTEYTGPLDFIIVKRVNENLEEYWAIVGNDTEFYISPGFGLIPPERHWIATEMSKDPTPTISYSVYLYRLYNFCNSQYNMKWILK